MNFSPYNLLTSHWEEGIKETKSPFFVERRSGIERRVFSYTCHVPERRSGIDRRQAETGNEQKE
jgi:hypothetical protein